LALAQQVGLSVPYQMVSKKKYPKLTSGIIATGDVFVNSAEKVKLIRTQVQADAIEMEGAAVAQVCYQLDIPCLIIRSISDNADGQAHKDLPNFEKVAAYNSAALVMAMLSNIKL
jgi:adenosylhomocysteine nucleosidase